MIRSAKLYINDILESIEKINKYTMNTTEEEFYKSDKIQDAVMRRYEIIGEAAGKILQEFSELIKKYENVPWREIADFKNVIVHEYYRLSLEKVWDITKCDLPELENKIKIIKEKELGPDLFTEIE